MHGQIKEFSKPFKVRCLRKAVWPASVNAENPIVYFDRLVKIAESYAPFEGKTEVNLYSYGFILICVKNSFHFIETSGIQRPVDGVATKLVVGIQTPSLSKITNQFSADIHENEVIACGQYWHGFL